MSDVTFKTKCNELAEEAARWSNANEIERERLTVAMDLFYRTFNDIMKTRADDRRKGIA